MPPRDATVDKFEEKDDEKSEKDEKKDLHIPSLTWRTGIPWS